jgi:hypothetical protein
MGKRLVSGRLSRGRPTVAKREMAANRPPTGRKKAIASQLRSLNQELDFHGLDREDNPELCQLP